MIRMRNALKKIGTAMAMAFALPGCSDAHEVPVNAAEAPEPGPALWQISDNDTTIYLFGTVHVLPADVDWYDQRIDRAFTSSSEFVTEIDMTDQAAVAEEIAGSAMLTNGQTLRSMMTDENRDEYVAAMVSLGLPAEGLDMFEPWFAAMNLEILPLLQSGYDPATGVEMSFLSRAEGKQRGALETIEEQIALFDTMPMDAQLTYLDSVVEAVPEISSTVDDMVAFWLEGDADGLGNMMNGEMDDPALYQRLLIDRNTNWTNWIAERLQQPGTVFVAVGAGHLAGEGSVQDQLATRGLEVTRIWQ